MQNGRRGIVPEAYAATPPWGGIRARLRASVGLRRLVPTTAALAGIDVAHRVAFRLSARHRAEGVAIVDAVVGATTAEADTIRHARTHLSSRARAWELQWRPTALAALPATGVDRLQDAAATGRGVILSYNHMNPVAAWPVMLAGRIDDLHYVHGDWLLQEFEPGLWSYQVAQVRRMLVDTGMTLIPATGARPKMLAALERGGLVFNGFDAPGSSPTPFLGKPVDLATGTARMAFDTGALVAPLSMVPAGLRYSGVVGDILDPTDHRSFESVHTALAAAHEELIMRAPAHLEDPRSRGWPEADRTGWRRTA